jgi:hypothetical protein
MFIMNKVNIMSVDMFNKVSLVCDSYCWIGMDINATLKDFNSLEHSKNKLLKVNS